MFVVNLSTQVASLRKEVERLKGEVGKQQIVEMKNVEEAGTLKGYDGKADEAESLEQKVDAEENSELAEVENLKPSNMEVVGEFSVEVSSDEETRP